MTILFKETTSLRTMQPKLGISTIEEQDQEEDHVLKKFRKLPGQVEKMMKTRDSRKRTKEQSESSHEAPSLKIKRSKNQIEDKKQIIKTIAATWATILSDGLLENVRKRISSRYQMNGDFEFLKASKLNSELKLSLEENKTLKNDETLVDIQNQLGSALVGIGKVIGNVFSFNHSKIDIDVLIDAAALITDVQHKVSLQRQRAMISGFNLSGMTDLSEIMKNLFDQRISDILKSTEFNSKQDNKDCEEKNFPNNIKEMNLNSVTKNKLDVEKGNIDEESDKGTNRSKQESEVETIKDVQNSTEGTTSINDGRGLVLGIPTVKKKDAHDEKINRQEITKESISGEKNQETDEANDKVLEPSNKKRQTAEEIMETLENFSICIIEKLDGEYKKRIESLCSDNQINKSENQVSARIGPVKPFPGIEAAHRHKFMAEGYCEEAATRMTRALAPTTLKRYEGPVRHWWNYCQKNNVDVHRGTDQNIVQFFIDNESNIGTPGTLKFWRSALGAILIKNPDNLSQTSSVSKYVRGFENECDGGKVKKKCLKKM
ncbi:uncharacterized protein [Venturia canescens]|uniref:uncharacterized protein n=1 Tax=Venturia canescens TaxID=32260 RepID=UPI001C9C6AC1|nr:uncharacterized protein LOC122413283 [Venturia canescens]